MSDLPPLQGAAVVRGVLGNHAVPPGAHPGLVFDRYLRIWSGGVDAPKKPEDPVADLRAFAEQFNRLRDHGEHTSLLAQQHRRLNTIAAAGGQAIFRTTFRLATGLGQEHPLENGFVFDPVSGAPYLPGSSVKGLLRAYWERHVGTSFELTELLGAGIEGPAGAPAASGAGTLVVLPALPETWPRLTVDIINCHHPGYHQSGGKSDPVDWENPNPVHFLAVDSGVDFVFRLGVRGRRPEQERARGRVQTAMKHLEAALGLLGIGAKTAVGYGVMTPPGKKPILPGAGVASGTAPKTGAPGAGTTPAGLDAAAIAGLIRAMDKGNAAARVPEIMRQIPADNRVAAAKEILKKLDRKWVLARKDQTWAAELLALAERA